jgi:hypothetical protein
MSFLSDGQNDFAVVVGLQFYPGLKANGSVGLSGPENDANDFYDWVISSTGGNLPLQNVSKILSSSFPEPIPDSDYAFALPGSSDIIKVFEKIRNLSIVNERNHTGSRVGRRLYIFMSGHGIAPNTYGNKLEKEAALLMCNVPPDNRAAPNYHIPGGYTANWFCENDCFEEVFLFMDCCRDPTIVPAINMYLPPIGNHSDTKRFYALSTRWSLKSREKMFNGRMRGVFTKVLLDALNGASAVLDPENLNQTIINGKSLKSFLYNNISKEVDSEYQEPDIDYFPKRNEGEDILVKTIDTSLLPTFPIEISVPHNASGSINIFNSSLNEVTNALIQDAPEEIDFELPLGKYLLNGIVNNRPKSVRFDVRGTECVENKGHVNL